MVNSQATEGPFLRLFRAWTVILAALYPAIVLTGAGYVIVASLAQGDAAVVRTIPASLAMVLGFGLFLGVPMALAFSVLALPLLMLSRFVVGARRPWLKPGYLAVALYGPAIIAIVCEGWSADQWPAIWLYETIALIATAI
jgi:hypothetical protein